MTRTRRRSTDIDTLVGNNVRHLRIRAGMSQTTLGEHLGITFQQIQKYEKGTNRISAGTLFELSRLFNVPVNTLFEGAPEIEAAAVSMPILSGQGFRMAALWDRQSPSVRKAVMDLMNALGDDDGEGDA